MPRSSALRRLHGSKLVALDFRVEGFGGSMCRGSSFMAWCLGFRYELRVQEPEHPER